MVRVPVAGLILAGGWRLSVTCMTAIAMPTATAAAHGCGPANVTISSPTVHLLEEAVVEQVCLLDVGSLETLRDYNLFPLVPGCHHGYGRRAREEFLQPFRPEPCKRVAMGSRERDLETA